MSAFLLLSENNKQLAPWYPQWCGLEPHKERYKQCFFCTTGANLKVISTMSVGVDHLALEEIKKR